RLASSNTGSLYSFDNRADLVFRIAVNPVNGDLYVASLGQILRSQDGGASWSAVLSSPNFSSSNQPTDIVISSSGKVYVAFSGTTNNGNDPQTVDGVWYSATGNPESFTRIAGTGAA